MEYLATSSWTLPAAGLLAGTILGFVARRQHFCTMSALERHWYAGDSHGLRTWVLAAAVALVLTQALIFAGAIDIGSSFYLSPDFGWTGAIIGGLAFGFGMALVGTCGFGALVRTGGGSLRSVVVLIMLGLSALAAQRGIVAQGRVHIVDNLAVDLSFASDKSIGALASALAGMDLRLPVAVIIALGLFWWIFRDHSYRKQYARILTGTVIGSIIVFGWLATSLAYQHAFDPVQIEAGSFVVPVGDTILQFATYTGVLPDYGVGLVIGVVLGAAISAFHKKDVRWEACDDARELSRHLMGGFLMGVGGVFAMGCTIGQGVTAISVLAISAPIVMASIAVGARMGLGYLIEGSPFAAFQGHGRQAAG
ncbi:YeeE/YedE family protein [Pseudaminobacter arsenicus]|uniref:YeeE/YedE family protein n=1 Tax=Borborobacter arsenicus TaxID=1851146 RepID=A0A432V0L3_9HYPH|nr:YeeE/YedE family protein [Pseudaminobacter arsenicus]RUM95700.1 YeeE/YedE family protein [Pseudaminobacter arsenicus]